MRFDGIRERVAWAYYDTLAAPDLPYAEGAALFNNTRNIGFEHLTNMLMPGAAEADATLVFNRAVVRTWADDCAERTAQSFLDEVEARLVFSLYIGSMKYTPFVLLPAKPGDKLPETAGARPGARNYTFHFDERLEVPARQCFGVDVVRPPGGLEDLFAFPGRKLVQVWLVGTKTRDVQ